MAYETVTIYRNRKTRRFIVQPMTKHPTGASANFGNPTEITEEDFDSRIVPVTLEGLSMYHKQRFDPEHAKSFSDDDHSKFVREHDCVGVTLDDTGLVEVVPERRVRGGYVGSREGKTTFHKDEIETRLADAIREAFESAS